MCRIRNILVLVMGQILSILNWTVSFVKFDLVYNGLAEHCKQPCCLDKGVGMCLLHRSYAIYCFFRHLVQDTDYTNCRFCSILKLFL